jgi:hypothetical protein
MGNPPSAHRRVNQLGDSLHSEIPIQSSHAAIYRVSRYPQVGSNLFDPLSVRQAEKNLLSGGGKLQSSIWVWRICAFTNKVISHKRKKLSAEPCKTKGDYRTCPAEQWAKPPST